MNEFNILICEDDKSDQRNIELHINSVKRILKDFVIKYKIVNFEGVFDEINNSSYNLLILDLYDSESNSNKGDVVLMHNDGGNKIPTLIYTMRGDFMGFEFVKKKDQYSFLIKQLVKIPTSGDNLIRFLIGFLIENSGEKFYKLHNENDTILKLSINFIGDNNFNYILFQIYNKFDKEEITVYPMTSGWSGAVLFKLQFKTSCYILKLSTEISKLKEEHKNGVELFGKFPTHLINPISSEEYYSSDNKVLGILIKNVDNPDTFFSFITNSSTSIENINNIFSKLYLEKDCLKDHFRTKKGTSEDWTVIFKKLDESKIHLINDSYQELKPIIGHYDLTFNIDDFRKICIDYDFENLNPTKNISDKFKKELVLSHGDFHAKNILVQSAIRPIIIDTGGLGYQHWVLDIARLLVNLFVNGLDKDSIDYFDLSRIEYQIEISKNIINIQPIEIMERDKNFNIISSINWLLSNIENIYKDFFDLYEFQLGLLKEFLQISYRVDTVPPNKRTVALIVAHLCLLKANDNILKNKK